MDNKIISKGIIRAEINKDNKDTNKQDLKMAISMSKTECNKDIKGGLIKVSREVFKELNINTVFYLLLRL